MLRFHDEAAGGRVPIETDRMIRTHFTSFGRSAVAVALAVTALTVADLATSSPAHAVDNTPWTLPSTPARCTTAQADSGDVAGCLLAFYDDPADTGWGSPPAPGVGGGWHWNGYTYNESPALAGWEANYIATNSTPVAGKPAGYLQTHVAAQTLFEGFLNEIAANGYHVRDVSGYSFRCTSGSGGWSCPSGDPSGLSNHAWGLAVDMNSGTNPIRNYSSVNGQTACLTPVQTDLPRWVIETAEKWGLYWGGYGWNNGCQSTSTQRTSVYRDPPHFEFRGTPAQAAAIADFNLRNDPSAVCFDVIDDDGLAEQRCTISGIPRAGWRLPVQLDPPADAVAALINLTGTASSQPGQFTIEDCGPQPSTRGTTSLSFTPGSAIATMAVAPLADDGTFCIWRSAAAHSIVDVIGYLTEGGDRVWIDPIVPTRITDSRREATCTPLGECQDGPVPDQGIRRLPMDDPSPRLANVTTTASQGWGFLQAGRCGEVGSNGNFSHLNFVDNGGARANLVLLEGDETGTCTFVHTGTHVIVDELARLNPDDGFGWIVTDAERILDTRTCDGPGCTGRLDAGEVVEVDLGVDVPAVAVAVTVTDTEAWGYATVAPCDELEAGVEPETSSVNHIAGQTATNLAITATDSGRFCVYTLTPADITIDVQALLVDDHTTGLVPAGPTRAHDSRV